MSETTLRRALAVGALIAAVASLAVGGLPWLVIAVVLLAVAHLI